MARLAPEIFKDARIIFRNFSGAKGPYNEEGVRSFTLVIPEDRAARMMEAGWNIKEKPAYKPDPGEPEFEYHLKVKVEYEKGRPPRCVLVKSQGDQTDLGSAEVGVLDFADLAKVDLTITPYSWTRPDGSGVSAYLKTIFATVVEDELSMMYDNMLADARVDLGDDEDYDA